MNDLIARLRAAAAIPTGLYAEAADALAAANAELAKAREQKPIIECFSKRSLGWRECGHPESCSNEKRKHYAAPVPAQPAAPEAVESLLPKGWVFYSADASIQSNDPRRPMTAMIKREIDGVQWWLQLTEEEKESTPLYSSGSGMTLTQAIQNAVAAILSATDSEVGK